MVYILILIPGTTTNTVEGGGDKGTAAPEAEARPASLAGTHAVLLKLLGLLPPGKSPHHSRIRALATLCSDLLQALAPSSGAQGAAGSGP